MTSKFLRSTYKKTNIRFGFCDIRNNQGLGKGYQPQPSVRLITLTSTLIILDITKTSSNNLFIKHTDIARNPNWSAAKQLAIYKRGREFELGATVKQSR